MVERGKSSRYDISSPLFVVLFHRKSAVSDGNTVSKSVWWRKPYLSFLKFMSQFSNSQNICEKGAFESVASLCKRSGCNHRASKTGERERIFKLIPTHIRFHEFDNFTEFPFHLGRILQCVCNFKAHSQQSKNKVFYYFFRFRLRFRSVIFSMHMSIIRPDSHLPYIKKL